jgi:hypothetical protein
MPATIEWSAQNSNVFRAHGIMSSHNTTNSGFSRKSVAGSLCNELLNKSLTQIGQ